jgi:hypothetical protein
MVILFNLCRLHLTHIPLNHFLTPAISCPLQNEASLAMDSWLIPPTPKASTLLHPQKNSTLPGGLVKMLTPGCPRMPQTKLKPTALIPNA